MIPDTTRRCTTLDNNGRSSFILDWGRCVLNIGCYKKKTLPLLLISSPPSQICDWIVIDEKPCLGQWVGANRTTSHYLYQIEPVRAYGAPFVSEVRQSGPWRTSVTDRWDGLLKQTARIPHADCCKSPPGRAVGSGRGRTAVTGRRDGLLKQTARIPGADCCRSSSERAVDGRPWRAAGRDFWNKRHGFLAPIVAEVRQSGPWTAGRDGPPGLTFETNGTHSWRRLLQKFVRAGRGRPAVTGRRDWLLKQTARIPGADCCRSSSERAVDGRPWRAAGIDFWNKRHAFLAPIVAEVRQSGPWTAGRDGPPERTFETNGTDSWRRLLQKSVRAGRGGGPWTDVRDGPLGCTFETNGTDSLRRLFQNSVRAGRGRPVVTGRWGVLLKQTAQIPGADCFRIPSERAVDGLSWRAAGMDFWNKWHGFLMPIVSKVSQIGSWTAGRDGPLGWTFETNGTDSSRRLLQKSTRAGRGVGPWTDGRDGPPWRTFETNGTDSWRRLLQKFVRAGRGRQAVTGRRNGLLKQTARIPGADCCRSSSERAVGAGRGRPAVTGCWGELLKQTARIPGADCFKSLSDRAVHVNQAAYHVYFPEPHWNSMGLPEITIW